MATLPNNEREIDHFLDGIMKPHERILFSARMILNPQLKTHVAVQKELRYQVLMYGRSKLRQEIAFIHEKVMNGMHPADHRILLQYFSK